MRSVAVIGSFRRHNDHVQEACSALRTIGINVTSPQGNEIINDGDDFVRFRQDDIDRADAEIQLIALHRIFRADVTYVVAPDGYVGKTTCYEIGRLIQEKKPVYFSEHPKDLPVEIPSEFIFPLNEFIERITNPKWIPEWAFGTGETMSCIMERELVKGDFRND